jgi:AcrR family transcriptional regulator
MKERIIETSGRLFMRYGVKSITMDDIAKELGISKKPFINIFQIKTR